MTEETEAQAAADQSGGSMSLPRPSVSRPSPTASPTTWRRGMASGSRRSSPASASAEAPPRRPTTSEKTTQRASQQTGSRFGGEDGGKFRALDGEIQSDETFDREIVDRMGPEFYEWCSNRPFGRRWPLVASTNRSGTPSAKTGNRRGADPSPQVDLATATATASRWLSRRRCSRRALDCGCRSSTRRLRVPRRKVGIATAVPKPDRFVGKRGNQAADDRSDPVDPPVGEVLLDDRRTDRPRRIHCRAGNPTAGQDVHGDDQANRQRRDCLWTARIDDGPKDDQDQEERHHSFHDQRAAD